MPSMMAPTLVKEGNGSLTALGSGGSNRIRTAILQVLINLLNFSMSVEEAVQAPRIHYEGSVLNLENGFASSNVAGLSGQNLTKTIWNERNLFFGGVHVARYDHGSRIFTGSGDLRRGGTFQII